VLQVAMAYSGGSDHERAVGNRLSYGFEFFSVGQQVRCAYGGACVLKGDIIGVYDPQVKKSKIAHCPSGGADVQGIARVHQDHAQMIEFSRNSQARIFYGTGRSAFRGRVAVCSANFMSKPFAVTWIGWRR
jgi:hypothetical protein